jgi:hypothetical protein
VGGVGGKRGQLVAAVRSLEGVDGQERVIMGDDGLRVQWAVLSKKAKGTKARSTEGANASSRPKPAGRAHHAACVIDSRYMLIHGGCNGLRPISCAWVLDLGTSSWTEVGVAARGGEHAPVPHPSARYGHSLTYFAVQRHVLLVGGLDAGKRLVLDTAFVMRIPEPSTCFLQDWQQCSWQPVRFQGASHFASKNAVSRGLHSMCQVDHSRVFVFGGIDDEVSPSPPAAGNLFLLTSQGSAKQCSAALAPFAGFVPKTCGQAPGERFGHASCMVETGSTLDARPVMLVVGGIHPRSRATLRDAYHLDLSPLVNSDIAPLFTWTRICLQPTPRFPSMSYLSVSNIPAAGLASGGALLLWGARSGVKGKERFSRAEVLLLQPCHRPSLATPVLSQPTKSEARRKRSSILSASRSGFPGTDTGGARQMAMAMTLDRTLLASALSSSQSAHEPQRLLERQLQPCASAAQATTFSARPDQWFLCRGKVEGTAPTPRFGHSVAGVSLGVGPQRRIHLVVFGGRDGTGRTPLGTHTHVLDISLDAPKNKQSGDRGRTDGSVSVKGVHGEIEKLQTSRGGGECFSRPHAPTGVHGEIENPESSRLVRSSSAWSDECEAVLNGSASECMQEWEASKEARKEFPTLLCSSLSPVRHGTVPQSMISQHATGARSKKLLFVNTNYFLTVLLPCCTPTTLLLLLTTITLLLPYY